MNAIGPSRPLGLPMWVVYSKPKDHPDGYIARRWVGEQSTLETIADPMLDVVRAAILERMPGAMRIERQAGDDPVIVEVWL